MKRLFSSALSKMYSCFQGPPCPSEGRGSAGESKDTQEQFAIQCLNAVCFFSPPPHPCVAGKEGRLRWHKQLSAQWQIKREAGKMRQGENGSLNEGRMV